MLCNERLTFLPEALMQMTEDDYICDLRSEYAYGVFNRPVARVAEQFKPGVETKKGASFDDIKAILDTGTPVLAWYVSAPMRDIMFS